MRVLVTGSRGLVGSHVVNELRGQGHDVAVYDLLDSQDIVDAASLEDAVRGCQAVIHSAALLGLPGETPDQILSVNLRGSSNVASAAVKAGVQRLVFLSSVDALGVFKGERPPDYLPLDNDHPCYPSTPYGLSKRSAEDMFRHVSKTHGLSTICLRPPGVWTTDTYGMIESERQKRPAFEWDPYWEYGAFIDVRDLSSACGHAIVCPTPGFHCVLIASSDLTTSGRESRDLAEFVHPDVEWRGGGVYDEDPYRSLLDIEPAQRLLDWSPQHTWASRPQAEAVR